MSNHDENTENSVIHTATTSKPENGDVAVEPVVFKKKLKPLFVLFAYGGGGKMAFLIAAIYKKRRLKKKYPNAEIRIIEGFMYPDQFKEEWSKLYNELNVPETASIYALWQIHYFGHGSHDCLVFQNPNNPNYGLGLYFNDDDNMERLPWDTNEGIFVLHSCRGGAYEDSFDISKIEKKICLAKTISEKQDTRCLGQTIFASFSIDVMQIDNYLPEAYFNYPSYKSKTTAEEDAINFQYRPDRFTNGYFAKLPIDKVLWGYALLTGDTYRRMLENKEEYEKKLSDKGIKNPIYPIYEEIKKLSPKNQILPCRVFNKGVLEERIVEVDVFNQNDMEYI